MERDFGGFFEMLIRSAKKLNERTAVVNKFIEQLEAWLLLGNRNLQQNSELESH